ncbi:MAG: serine/threonine-protein kinase [Polyangiaceae bacterium]
MFVCPDCGYAQDSAGFCTEHGVSLADAAGDRLLGQVVGRYRVARLIGRGGMGEVYLGVQPDIGSRVAIKLLPLERTENPTLVERFFAEARAVNLIRHEGIVNVLDLATLPDGRPYIVMEYLEGAPLSAFIARGPIAIGTMAALTIDVASALSAAHERGIVHRDLKPDNIYVTATGRPKILDFGIAKLRPELGAADVATKTGALLGTPHYMSPEQALGRAVDPRSDIYSLGIILFEAVTGQKPFDADSLFELLRHHVDTPAPSPRSSRPELSPGYEQVILRALAKDPNQRFQNAYELISALHEAVRGLDDTAYVSLSRYGSLPPSGAARTPVYSQPGPISAAPSGPVAPTLAAVGSTLDGQSPSRGALWAVLGALSLLVLGLGAVVVFVFVLRQGVLPSSSAGPTVSPAPASTNFSYRTVVGGWNPKQFHLAKALEVGDKEARTYFSDAELVTYVIAGATASGVVDLTSSSASIALSYRSPSASEGKRMGKCMVTVSISGEYLTSTSVASTPCYQVITGPPKCSVPRVFEKARGMGASVEDGTTLTFMQIASSPAWQVQLDGGTKMVPDDC